MSIADRLLIRPAVKDDLDVLVDFSHAMALETEGRQLEKDRLRHGTLAVLESDGKGLYVVAELSEASPKVVGQLLITYEWSDWRNAVFWWIQSVYVHPAWRRHGVYRHLHESVIKMARGRSGVCGLRLYVEQNNRMAQYVYRRVGLTQSSYLIFEEDFVLPKAGHIGNPSV